MAARMNEMHISNNFVSYDTLANEAAVSNFKEEKYTMRLKLLIEISSCCRV